MSAKKSICYDNHSVDDKFQELKISMPAKRALEREGINSTEELANYSEKELLTLYEL